MAPRRRWSVLALCNVLCSLLLAALPHAVRASDEVPFITTPDAVTLAMLQLAGVGAADHVIDLGSGDGRIVITAARRFGASGLGVEIVRDLVLQSRASAAAAGVQDLVEFREQDLFATELTRASVITLYLLPDVNLQLRPRLLALAPGTRVVSHDWDMGDWRPDRSLTLDVPDKAVGRDKLSRLHLWVVPAAVQGPWCAGAARLTVTQRFQQFSATLEHAGLAGPLLVFDGRLEGLRLQGRLPSGAEVALRREAAGLRLLSSPQTVPGLEGRLFTPAPAGGCG